MRIKTPINREAFKHHLNYGLWKYALMAACVIMGWSLIYTATTYRSPQDKRVDVYILSNTASDEMVQTFLEPVWKETVPEMEVVNGVVMSLLDDYTTTMQLMTYMAAAEADIYFINEQYFKSYASQGYFLELEGLVESGQIDACGADLTKGYVTSVDEYDDQDRPVKTSSHLYGIPMDSFYGFMGGMQLDNRGMYAVITVNNQNDENVIPFFSALLKAGQGEKEEWITE